MTPRRRPADTVALAQIKRRKKGTAAAPSGSCPVTRSFLVLHPPLYASPFRSKKRHRRRKDEPDRDRVVDRGIENDASSKAGGTDQTATRGGASRLHRGRRTDAVTTRRRGGGRTTGGSREEVAAALASRAQESWAGRCSAKERQ